MGSLKTLFFHRYIAPLCYATQPMKTSYPKWVKRASFMHHKVLFFFVLFPGGLVEHLFFIIRLWEENQTEDCRTRIIRARKECSACNDWQSTRELAYSATTTNSRSFYFLEPITFCFRIVGRMVCARMAPKCYYSWKYASVLAVRTIEPNCTHAYYPRVLLRK